MPPPPSSLSEAIRRADLVTALSLLDADVVPDAEVAIAFALLSERLMARQRQGVKFPGSTFPLLRQLLRCLDAKRCPWDVKATRISGGDTARSVVEYALPGILLPTAP